MLNLYVIGRIAFYEARLLVRSWGFRIFAGLGLSVITLLNIAIATPAFYSPHFLSSLSGSLPLNSLKLFNIFQGIIVAFMATEFFKRDRRHDSAQVVLARSFTNVDYYLGKALGLLMVFALLNLALLLLTFVVHVFFSSTPFLVQPYLLYTLFICLPTVTFMVGLSFLLSSLLRNQVLVFIVLLAYSFLVLVFLGTAFFGLFDAYAFYLPLLYSDFIGLGNYHSQLLLRLAYTFLGLSFIFVSPLLFKRLRQSALSNLMAGSLSIVCLVLALIIGLSYTRGKYADREYRQQLRTSSQTIVGVPALSVLDYAIGLEHEEQSIKASVNMKMTNETSVSLDSFWLTLNPRLKVQSVTQENQSLNFKQNEHLIEISPRSPINPGGSIDLSISYSGTIDERYCYLDIDDVRFEDRFRLWIYDIPKHYALVTPAYVHLTPECGWYPISGLSTAKAFPDAAAPQFCFYTLSVLCSEDLTAISQGSSETKSFDDKTEYTFKSEAKLLQISLTIGTYEHREIQVENITYSLYLRPGHDYFTPHLNEIGEDLPDLIRALKDEYEVNLDLDYPFKRLSLVEVPIHIYSYLRLWTVAFETVQPQFVFLPEMGTTCANADFETQARIWEKWGKKGKGKGDVTLAEAQAYFFNNFVRTNLLNAAADQIGYIKGEGMAVTFQADIEPQFEIFPNFVTYTTYFSSSLWPVLHFALETYIRERYAAPLTLARRGGLGLTREEAINLDLKEHSLSELMEDSTQDAAIVQGALQAKSRMLLALLEAKSQDSDFGFWVTDFLRQYRFRSVPQEDLSDFFLTFFDINLTETLDVWYRANQIPGYLFSDVVSYNVIDREKTWTQINVKVGNPTSVDGVVNIGLRYRDKDKKAPGGRQTENIKALFIPAETTIDIGISVDSPPALLSIDTLVSQNIPVSLSFPFVGSLPQREEKPYEKELSKPFDSLDFLEKNEYIIDNQDEGFKILSEAKESWLSRNLQKLPDSNGKTSRFTEMNVYNPPVFWELQADQAHYGQIIRSAYLKKSGEGDHKVAWNVELEEAGEYDIYFFYGISAGMQKGKKEMEMLAAARNQGKSIPKLRGLFNRGPGTKHFLVSHRYGFDDVVIDIENAEQGWNFIGSFQLDSGPNRVEQTDKSDTSYIMADAVKWVKK